MIFNILYIVLSNEEKVNMLFVNFLVHIKYLPEILKKYLAGVKKAKNL